MSENKKAERERYYRKRVELFRLIDKIKIWPSRKGLLHGIRTTDKMGDVARVTTHCNKTFMVNNSRNSRAARWLRNKWFTGVCPECRIPDWKLAKYSSTHFRRHHGSDLQEGGPPRVDLQPAAPKGAAEVGSGSQEGL